MWTNPSTVLATDWQFSVLLLKSFFVAHSILSSCKSACLFSKQYSTKEIRKKVIWNKNRRVSIIFRRNSLIEERSSSGSSQLPIILNQRQKNDLELKHSSTNEKKNPTLFDNRTLFSSSWATGTTGSLPLTWLTQYKYQITRVSHVLRSQGCDLFECACVSHYLPWTRKLPHAGLI